MRRLVAALFVLLSLSGQSSTLTTAREYNRFMDNPTGESATFALTGRVNGTSDRLSTVLLEDATGVASIYHVCSNRLSVGDVAVIRGLATAFAYTLDPNTKAVTAETIGRTNLPVACDVPLSQLSSLHHRNRLVRTEGVILDIVHDDVDEDYDFLILQDDGITLPVLTSRGHFQNPDAYLGATVRLTCTYRCQVPGSRHFLGDHLVLKESIAPEVLRPATSPFDAPLLGTLPYMSPDELSRLGRRRMSGIVLATWHRNKLLLMTSYANYVEVTLTEPNNLPGIGDRITVSGFPETDSFALKLGRATCRTDLRKPLRRQDVLQNGHKIIRPGKDGTIYDTDFRDRRIQLRGHVRAVTADAYGGRSLTLESDGVLIPVELGDRYRELDVPLGAELEATGICIFSADDWSPLRILPRLRGAILVPQYDDDLRVLSRPPWWTPRRLGAVILVLIGLLIGVYAWNRSLARLAVRRGRELFRAEFAASRSELRTGERTRLAIELHDALSQTLTGVACQVSAARRALQAQSPAVSRHLETADKMLLSCRSELRRCLWDLRSNALEERDFTAALRMTVSPAIGEAELAIRFNVLRSRLDDSVTHAVLCIVRELCTNAVRHGGASRLLVAGELHDGRLSFSVRDNGSGFDPASVPGPEEGHFGLSGIRERIRGLHGSLTFARAANGGMRVTVGFPLEELPA